MPLAPTPLRLLQTLGITTSGILAGTALSFTFYATPRLLELPTPLLLQQWQRTYKHGARTMPFYAGVSAAIYGYLAWDSRAHFANSALVWTPFKSQWKGYVAAAALTVGIVPFTLLCMMRTVDVLMAKANEVDSVKGKEKMVGTEAASVQQLLDHWATLNLARALLLVGATAVGAWTALA